MSVLSQGEKHWEWLAGARGALFVVLVSPVLPAAGDAWDSQNQTQDKEAAFGSTRVGGPAQRVSQGQDL